MGSSTATLIFNDDSKLKIDIKAGESLLHAAERQKIMLPNSCREGTCGSCMGRCRSGAVKHSESAIGLSQKEIDGGLCITLSVSG